MKNETKLSIAITGLSVICALSVRETWSTYLLLTSITMVITFFLTKRYISIQLGLTPNNTHTAEEKVPPKEFCIRSANGSLIALMSKDSATHLLEDFHRSKVGSLKEVQDENGNYNVFVFKKDTALKHNLQSDVFTFVPRNSILGEVPKLFHMEPVQ